MIQQALLGQVADVDIRLLRVFRAVAESGGLAAAESELNIGRSTISRHLNDLEARLGVTLCSRGRAGFALTGEGDVIYRAALRLLANIETFRSEVNEVRQQIAGHLTLAFFDKTATNPAAQIGAAI
ncbi:MAG: LysR family transcriptional regulator, partial [Gammaproteobacteria bacterium]|nr:LysR family transcriptional regulator [Gammaproteobacteria bacterium]